MTTEFPSATTEQYLQSRKKIVEDFKKSVLGNDWRDLEEQEIFFNPVYQYVCGVLYPRETGMYDKDLGSSLELEQEKDNDEYDEYEESEDLEEKKSKTSSSLASGDENDEEDMNVIDLSSNSRQSAFGLSFITENNEILKVKYGFSTYELLKKNKESKESKESNKI